MIVRASDTHKRLSYMRVTGLSELSRAPKSKSNPADHGISVAVLAVIMTLGTYLRR